MKCLYKWLWWWFLWVQIEPSSLKILLDFFFQSGTCQSTEYCSILFCTKRNFFSFCLYFQNEKDKFVITSTCISPKWHLDLNVIWHPSTFWDWKCTLYQVISRFSWILGRVTNFQNFWEILLLDYTMLNCIILETALKHLHVVERGLNHNLNVFFLFFFNPKIQQ